MTSTGPATRATCRVIAGNSCGSGTICGRDTRGSYVLSNAHVTGTRVGSRSVFEVESLDRRQFEGRIVRAAYSGSRHADWSLSYVEGLTDVKPVHLTNRLPMTGESFYTKGFPRCQPMQSGNIEPVRILNNGVMLWEPDAIGGQSGSGIFADTEEVVVALLTWSMRYEKWFGAGQLTNEIWTQNRDFVLGRSWNPKIRLPGWEYVERPEPVDDETKASVQGMTDTPDLSIGLFGEVRRGIQDYPIWAHMFDATPTPTDPIDVKAKAIAALNRIKESVENEIQAMQSSATDVTPVDPGGDLTFGL